MLRPKTPISFWAHFNLINGDLFNIRLNIVENNIVYAIFWVYDVFPKVSYV